MMAGLCFNNEQVALKTWTGIRMQFTSPSNFYSTTDALMFIHKNRTVLY